MDQRPNILFIMADDHAAKAIGAYGSGLLETPNIDRLALEGMRLDHCYVTNSICTPSRASILTGTYNHVNGVTTLETLLDNRWPNVAKALQARGYATAIFGKWHLGEGPRHEPAGFEDWCVLPGQGDYFDPRMVTRQGGRHFPGYVTDVITDLCVDWLTARDRKRPFFLMCHHKAPHRSFSPAPRHAELFAAETISMPATFDDDYANRARAAREARMRVRVDMTYQDLGLVEPEGLAHYWYENSGRPDHGKVPTDPTGLTLYDRNTGEPFTFATVEELDRFKYQRYIKRYLRTIVAIDESVGRLLDLLEESGDAENTIVVYTSDQGFFLGEHGWFDKRFIYEESLQMPCLIRYPAAFGRGIGNAIATNVDFAPTFLDYAGVSVPSYMQGRSLRPVLEGRVPADWQDVAYHRYWMHKDDIHNAFAHYGVRDQRHKLIYWYNDPLGQPGAHAGDEPPEWELFDCVADPFELCNVFDNPEKANVVRHMLAKLDAKMSEIGDIPAHDSASVLAAIAARQAENTST
ncbi:sulfatase family protein [Acuticoccus sediminis]|uniref:sulfatase family protein n=1 Tax=Acuticoccus sediminis TaxID=2184697 RepID=UPI001CFE964A|nr:sulfatase [Acuticoccus sediminis]